MKKAIALKDTDEELAKIFDQIAESKERYSQKLTFIRKQSETAKDEFKKEQEPLWTAMKARLRELKRLPDDYKDTDTLSYEREAGVLYWMRDEGDSVTKFMRDFFGIEL